MPTRYELHCRDWKDGCGSEFCDGARRKTFYRGTAIPCDILFVGEAPGKSENIAGIPFAPGARAGALLTDMVKRSVPEYHKHKKVPCGPEDALMGCDICGTYEAGLDGPCRKWTIGFTNIVACIPRLDGEEKIEPDPSQIKQCKPRLEELIEIANPKIIFAVGSQSRDALTQGYLHSTRIPAGCTVHHIVHPAWILRQTTAFQGLKMQEVICQIRDAIHDYENPRKKEKIPAQEPTPKKGLKQPKSNTQQGKSGILPTSSFVNDDPDHPDNWPRSSPTYDEDIPF